MSASPPRIAIVGAGLSGLYAAALLEQHGLAGTVVFEARSRLGGRILSRPAQNLAGTASTLSRFDLGPTWYWPAFQPELDQLVDELGIARWSQYDSGDWVVEHPHHAQPLRVSGYADGAGSTRLAHGMQSLVDALHARLRTTRVLCGQAVHGVHRHGEGVRVLSTDAAGAAATVEVDAVMLAMPPRLAVHALRFEPALPAALARQWQATPTWMAGQAKYLAIYDRAFWREAGLAGAGRSARGPLAEIHDASTPDGDAALFGFIGVPAPARAQLPPEQLRMHCRAQLGRMFGPLAATPREDWIQDWAQEPHTATPADQAPSSHHHAAAAQPDPHDQAWGTRLLGVASEWSTSFPGYVAGAIDAASQAVEQLAQQLDARASATR